MNQNRPFNLQDLINQLQVKRDVFISYHHADQYWVDEFRRLFSGTFEVFTDRSLSDAIDSDNLLYVNQAISERHISGTSVTIVMCGNNTWRRKCVDWEIYTTLRKDHGLLGIILPDNQPVQTASGPTFQVPDRLHANIISGYAKWMTWPADANVLKDAINTALQAKKDFAARKDNSAPRMQRNH